MDKSILISTTNHIENASIEKYFGAITAHVVFGTHFFSDFAASFTDFFGGQSGTYQRKLETLYKIATDQLKEKAYQKGANAIIGLKIDFDEISGKGKSMFMVTAIGTAVKLKFDSAIEKQEVDQVTVVSLQELDTKLEHRRLISVLKSDRWIRQEDWEFLFENPTNEINETLLNIYASPRNDIGFDEQMGLIQNINAYFGRIDSEDAIECLYNRVVSDSKYANIIRVNNLFSPSRVLNLLDKGRPDLAATCLDINKSSYDKETDIPIMEELVRKFDNLPDTGEIKLVKGSMLSKDKEKFICSEGHQNDVCNKFCEKCGRNIKGLTQDNIATIKKFKNKISILKEMMR